MSRGSVPIFAALAMGVLVTGAAQGAKKRSALDSLPTVTLQSLSELRLPGADGKGAAIPAVSGAVQVGKRDFFVSDSQKTLFELDPSTRAVKGYALGGDPVGVVFAKALKPDFEALAFFEGPDLSPDGALVAWPSASTPARELAAVVALGKDGTPGKVRDASIGPFATELRRSTKGLNLEGLVVTGADVRIFQRGNEKGSKSGIFTVPKAAFLRGLARGEWREAIAAVRFEQIKIGRLDRVKLTFTDAAVYGKTILALAAAEATDSSYDDGEVRGSVLLAIQEGKITPIARFTPVTKLEALLIRSSGAEGLELFLFDDADDEKKSSRLYRATVPLALLPK